MFRNKPNSTGKDGSLVVISHDRDFCEKVGFTHIGTVMGGKLVLEQVSPPTSHTWTKKMVLFFLHMNIHFGSFVVFEARFARK